MIAVPSQRKGGNLLFVVTQSMLDEGKAVIVLNRPPGSDVSDRDPPSIESVTVDGHEFPVQEKATLPYQPREIVFEVAGLAESPRTVSTCR